MKETLYSLRIPSGGYYMAFSLRSQTFVYIGTIWRLGTRRSALERDTVFTQDTKLRILYGFLFDESHFLLYRDHMASRHQEACS